MGFKNKFQRFLLHKEPKLSRLEHFSTFWGHFCSKNGKNRLKKSTKVDNLDHFYAFLAQYCIFYILWYLYLFFVPVPSQFRAFWIVYQRFFGKNNDFGQIRDCTFYVQFSLKWPKGLYKWMPKGLKSLKYDRRFQNNMFLGFQFLFLGKILRILCILRNFWLR